MGIDGNVEIGPITIVTPFGTSPPFEVGFGFELIYDWANDSTPGTGWNLFWYPQVGGSSSPGNSAGFGGVTVYNFTPEDYTNAFYDVNAQFDMTGVGRPSFGYSATGEGVEQKVNRQPVTRPYS